MIIRKLQRGVAFRNTFSRSTYLTIVEIAYFRVVEVCYLLLRHPARVEIVTVVGLCGVEACLTAESQIGVRSNRAQLFSFQ